jgi:hypothetical protein
MSLVLYSREATVDKVVRKIHELGQQGVQFATFPETRHERAFHSAVAARLGSSIVWKGTGHRAKVQRSVLGEVASRAWPVSQRHAAASPPSRLYMASVESDVLSSHAPDHCEARPRAGTSCSRNIPSW